MAKECQKLLALIGISCDDSTIIQGITCDSREVKQDWLFVSLQGMSHNGDDFIDEVRAKGGIVITSHPHPDCYEVSDPQAALVLLINDYYDSPSDKLTIIGVTGTNGKTSVCSFLSQMFTEFGQRNVVIGTNGIQLDGYCYATQNTTPGMMVCLRVFLEAIRRGIHTVMMEVSSHAIDEGRLGFIRFDRLIYTNITQDHLDYHLTFTHYQYTKFKARLYLKENGRILLNQDRDELMEMLHLRTKGIITYGLKPSHVQISNVELRGSGSSFDIGQLHFETCLLSMNNVYNLAACIALFKSLGIHSHELCEVVSRIEAPAGRMEVLKLKNHTIWIDYAHTPDALRRLLEFANQVCIGRIITVLGCGGERDQDKRHQMGTIASTLSYRAIFTEDNSRGEDPVEIIKQMSVNVLDNVCVLIDRQKAIAFALSISMKSDIIIIAGKGNEQFLIVKEDKIPYNDKAFILKLTEEEPL